MARILVVDDEMLILNVLKTVLSSTGHEPVTVQDGHAAVDMANAQHFDLMISDLRMSPIDGIEVLRQIRKNRPALPVIMMTGYGTVKSAIDAMSLNVFDYVSKPFRVEEFLTTVQQALLYGQAEAHDLTSSDDLSSAYRIGSLIGLSEAMVKVCELIQRVASANIPVLLSGEYGVGREMIARTIHESSPRKAGKFLVVPCAELPEPLFDVLMFGNGGNSSTAVQSGSKGFVEEAEGGTLLLTDATLIPSSVQSTFVDIAQRTAASGKPLSGVRLIGATTDRPDSALPAPDEVALFRRLGAMEIRVPPLRDRREDILPLALHILKHKNNGDEKLPLLEWSAREALMHYAWPGNVSELDKAIEYGLAHLDGGRITRQSLPPRVAQHPTADNGDAKTKRDQLFGKNKALKTFLRKPLQDLKIRQSS